MRGADEAAAATPCDLQQLRRLVELQSQVVTLVKQNEETEKHCKDLWHELERNALLPVRKPRGFHGLVPLAERLAALRDRLVIDLRERIGNAAP